MIRPRFERGAARRHGPPSARQRPASARQERPDESGFSLIELLVALGIFSILMVIVTALTITSLRAISEARQRSDLQVESQNAMEWISRLLKYADVPEGGSTAIQDASADSITVYTYSGTGDVPDAPYRARVFTEPGEDGSTVLVTEVTSPVRVDGGWAWSGPTQQRRLLTLPSVLGDVPLSIEYWVCDPDDCQPSPYSPTGTGPLLDPDSTLVPAYLVVSLGDPSLPDTQVRQTIELVNLR